MAFILIVGSVLFPMIVSLPIHCFLVRKERNKPLVAENGWKLRKTRILTCCVNIGITAGLTVFVYWALFKGL